MDNNKALMYSTGNYIQYLVINHNGKEYKKRMYVCVKLSHFAVQQRLAQHCKSTILQFKEKRDYKFFSITYFHYLNALHSISSLSLDEWTSMNIES